MWAPAKGALQAARIYSGSRGDMNEQLVTSKESGEGGPRGWAAERRAVSREMHDRIAHSILVVQSDLELLELHRRAQGDVTSELLRDAKEAAARALEEVRGLAARLRVGADIEEEVCGADTVPEGGAGNELFFVLSEAIRNALLHANAGRVTVDLRRGEKWITAVVEDDGDGFEPGLLHPAQSVGITSMNERTAMAGGRLDIRSSRHQGTRIAIRVPCRESA
ncbi:MAG: hypothetical protein GEV11_02965 [Streptosporangiales bacterium]|nr:hypothetical protein [Streptosporangiales bacterium]